MAARLVDGIGLRPGQEVLDVGCGTGNVAITAGARGAEVTGVDVDPAMLDRARERTAGAGVDGVEWCEGSATDLPFADNRFDAALSALGHIYGDPADEAANELTRVTRPGGRIGFTSWTPSSLYPGTAADLVSFLDPADRPDYGEPPFTWGDRQVVERRQGSGVTDLTTDTTTVSMPALSPRHFWGKVASTSGVFATLLDAVDDRGELREKMIETIEPCFDRKRNRVTLEYLQTTATVPRLDR